MQASDIDIRGFSLSPQQRQIWRLQQANTTFARNTVGQATLIGVIDVARLQAAAVEVVRRHEILRTTYRFQSGLNVPLQIVMDSDDVAFTACDLSELEDNSRLFHIHALLLHEETQPKDLERGPIVGLTYIKLHANRHLIIISATALACDRRSMKTILDELIAGLDSARTLKEEQPVQYREVASAFNEFASGEGHLIGKAYFRGERVHEHLNDGVPYDLCKIEPASAFETGAVRVDLPRCVIESINSRCGDMDVPVQTFLLTCWQALYFRLTGRCVCVTGVAFECRPDEVLSGAVGPFERFIPLSSRTGPGALFNEVLDQTARKLREVARRQEDFDWDQLTSDAGNEARPAFCDWCFSYDDYRPPSASPRGLHIDSVALSSRPERFKVLLSITARGGDIEASVHFDTSVVKDDDACDLAHRLVLIATSASSSNPPLCDLPILGETEEHALIYELGTGRRPEAVICCLHQLFESRVRACPDAVAIVFEECHLSFEALNVTANRLAWYLLTHGVKVETRVALHLGRTPELVSAMLAVLKAGAAYISVDPGSPPARTKHMIEDAGVTSIIASRRTDELTREYGDRLIALDEIACDWEATGNPPCAAVPENLAYLIYTSGSTGKPKAVAVEHRQIVNYVIDISDRFLCCTSRRLAMVSSLASDLGNTTLFGSLCSGGCLHVIPEAQCFDGRSLATYLARTPMDYLKLTPSHAELFMNPNDVAATMPRRILFLGGEALHWDRFSHLHSHRPECKIVNHYGPTETAVGCCVFEIPSTHELSGRVPIGRPLGWVHAYVLNAWGCLVPANVVGELYIGGRGVTRGYLGDARLTAERFLPDPYTDVSGGRLYRTGDKARWNRAGHIEFLGRIDVGQIKIRGHRVEIREIEEAIESVPRIRKCAVVVDEDAIGNQKLTAYVVRETAAIDLNSAELRKLLADKLPHYMVPGAFVYVGQLPFMPNGKLDRSALAGKKDHGDYVAPRNAVEEILCRIWADVLHLEHPGVADDFFELGGHSLVATQVISRVEHLFESDVSLRLLFESRTVERFAKALLENPNAARIQTIAETFVAVTKTRPTRDVLSAAHPSHSHEI